jgi:hypothetical protein
MIKNFKFILIIFVYMLFILIIYSIRSNSKQLRYINVFSFLFILSPPTVSPMIWVPNQLVGAPSGTNVTIDCHTEAHPRAISYWMFNNSMVLSTDKYVTENEENSYRTHMRLTIKNLQSGDFGNYRCISKNSLGETEGSIRLYGKSE